MKNSGRHELLEFIKQESNNQALKTPLDNLDLESGGTENQSIEIKSKFYRKRSDKTAFVNDNGLKVYQKSGQWTISKGKGTSVAERQGRLTLQ